MFSAGLTGSKACQAIYDHVQARLYLLADDSTMMGPAAPGVPGTLANSQCSLDTRTLFGVSVRQQRGPNTRA